MARHRAVRRLPKAPATGPVSLGVAILEIATLRLAPLRMGPLRMGLLRIGTGASSTEPLPHSAKPPAGPPYVAESS